MFIQWWERIRGIDQWPEVRAEIDSVRSLNLPSGAANRLVPSSPPVIKKKTFLEVLRISYKSADGALYSKGILLITCPLLFVLNPGDHFCVQYCPRNPARLYIRERTQGYFAFIGFLVVVGVVCTLFRK
jgi:hypothetical protein